MKLPKVDALTFSISGAALGFILIDDLNADEQNALGNWLMLTAQVLCTNSTYQQLLIDEEEKTKPDEVEILKKMIKALEKQIDDINNKL